MDLLKLIEASDAYLPHGYCFAWTPSLLWLHVVSDLVIAASYYSISIALLYFARKRQDVVFRGIFVLFGAFILACATTHVLGAWTIWHPSYWTDGTIKAITAIVSLGTAVVVWPLIPQALEIPSRNELVELNRHLAAQVAERKQAEDRLRMVFEAEPECVKTVASDGTLLDMNRAGLEMIEADSIEQVRGKPISDLVDPAQREAYEAFYRRVLQGESGTFEFQITGLKGSKRWLETHAVPFRSETGTAHSLLSVTRDITERKRTDEAMRLAATAFETSEAILIADSKGVVQRINSGYTAITGYSPEDVVGTPSKFLRIGLPEAMAFASISRKLNRDDSWKGEVTAHRKDGEAFPAWLSIKAVRNEQQELTHYVATFVDVSERQQAQREIEQLAYFDPLTGLPNRRLLIERLNRSIAGNPANPSRSALLFIDLDHFKHLNDARGHTIGDQLLRRVAERLSEGLNLADTVARLGGDEFVILLEGLNPDYEAALQHALQVAENLRLALQQPFDLSSGRHHITASIGATVFPVDAASADDLLKAADMAMYQAKADGRNTVRTYASEMHAAAEARLLLQRDMHAALENNEFRIYFQPQVDRNEEIVGAEVLVRWQHPVHGLMLPDKFIPLAEETGLILPIGEWVFEQACRESVRLAEAGHKLRIAANVSPRRFRQPDFFDRVHAILKQTGADPHGLTLEITEGMLVADIDDAIEKMTALQGLGLQFSIDDFGTGYSSLAYLKRLPLRELKIAQTFVEDLPNDPSDVALVETILSMAYHLNLETVAEGVETREQAEFLKERGCQRFQGYYFSRPIPAYMFLEKLETATAAEPAHPGRGT